MPKHLALLFALTFAGISAVWAALAEKRVALVIGNSAYKHAPALPNPRNDAEAIAGALKRLNFDVVLGVDLDETGMRRQLQDFANRLESVSPQSASHYECDSPVAKFQLGLG